MHSVSALMPPVLIAREHVILVRVVKSKTPSNYGASLLRFTQICDAFNIPEELHMPIREWLLSMFIMPKGTGAVGGGALNTWLLGLQLCMLSMAYPGGVPPSSNVQYKVQNLWPPLPPA